MSQFQIPKGTFDILPTCAEEPWRASYVWQWAESILRKTALEYGFREIRTPIFERTELFDRGVGETSDIVTKEMFTFDDRGGRSMTLRPEGTAAVMRALIDDRLLEKGPVHKLFYIGPMFRYERPQSGRYRQHHQFGAEAVGVSSPEQDVEIISLLLEVYRRLGLRDLKVLVNTVGDPATRDAYRAALQDYFRPHLARLSPESQVRFEKNPLRILDSKDPADKELVATAPSILHYLSPASKAHFSTLCHLLEALHIPYQMDDKIVRGLDYYHHTVFEIVTQHLGAQNTVGAGGRYDGLMSQFGGPDLPGVGFGTGIERILQTLIASGGQLPPAPHPFLYFVPLGEEARSHALQYALACRREGIPAELDLHAKKIGTALQHATRLNATYALLLGSEELARGEIVLKHLVNREQRTLPLRQLVVELTTLWNTK